MKKIYLFVQSVFLVLMITGLSSFVYADNCIIPKMTNPIGEPKDIDVLAKNRPYLKGLVSKYGPVHLKYADALVNHAQICWRAGLYQESEASYKKAIIIYEKKLGEKNRTTQITKADLAKLYKKFGCQHKEKLIVKGKK